ncbi:PREDICTED: uncharacterized protein LOC107604463 [Ficedula albicollis]|uniref:uncharacterized protein LOC107604463 n=1 Tax=Ficedula albicollis TaxID=59894 RepID=UPI0007AD7F09|nr:PREDICTED: uncharacterized protein LOC107604463 [Ficedula albicollis]
MGVPVQGAAWELFHQVLEAVRHCTSCGVLHMDIKPENILLDLATGQAKSISFGCGTYLQDTAYTHFAALSGFFLVMVGPCKSFRCPLPAPVGSFPTQVCTQVPGAGERAVGHSTCHWGRPCMPRDAGARLWEYQHPPDELHLYSIRTLSYRPLEWTHFGWYYGKPATIWSLGILLHQMVCREHPFRRGQNISWDQQLSLPQRLSQGGSSSLCTGGIPVLGDSSGLVSILLWQLLRGWHMSCPPALLLSSKTKR